MNGMNGMRGMRNITDFTCLSFKRLTPGHIDMSNMFIEWMEWGVWPVNEIKGLKPGPFNENGMWHILMEWMEWMEWGVRPIWHE